MERRIVTLAPHRLGWRIEVPERKELLVRDMPAALAEAWRVANEVHRTTGAPTAVNVRMGAGEGVMIGYHG